MQKKWGKIAQNSPKLPEKALNLMIYVNLVENLVDFKEETSEFDNVVYILDWNMDKLIRSARPWKVLGRKDNVYKLSIIDEFFEPSKFDEQPDEFYNKFSEDLYSGLLDTAQKLEAYKLISPKLPKLPDYELIYNCDILNMLEDYYGPENLQLIQDYIDLNPEETKLLDEFYKEITKEKQIALVQDYLPIISVDKISDFLPGWCKDSIKIFGSGKEENLKPTFTPPQFKDQTPLGYTDKVEVKKEMIEEIYSEFEIGSVLRGSEIRTRFREICKKYGMNPKSGLVDFMEYFVIRKARSEYEWLYRIIRRKKNEVLEDLKSASA